MTTRTSRRARAPARKRRRSAAGNPARFLPTLERYTPALLAHVRQRFEETPEPVAALAADLGIASQSVNRIARRYGWVRRNPVPMRDVPRVVRILEEAQALEAQSSVPVGDPPPTPDPSPPLASRAGGGERAEPAASQPTGLSTIERLERAVLAELATIEALRAALGTLPHKPPGARHTVRTLGMLTQTLQHLQRLRASQALEARTADRNESNDHDDDMPRDIDEFRRDLARRIDAFVESREDTSSPRGDGPAATLDRA